MKSFASLLITSVLLTAATTDLALTRPMLIPVEKRIDQRLETLFDEPFLVLGMTRGLYLEKFGVVFSAELQLVSTPGVGTFGFTTPTKEMISATRLKKLDRLPLLRDAMRAQMVSAATSLDKLPVDEKVVFGLSIFRRSWEDSSGIPAQIVMQATRKDLLSARSATAIESAIRMQEF